MSLSARMAWRYLRAPKSYSAVSAIAYISMAGVAVATAAIVCVLSVFNGFQGLLTDKFDSLAPDIEITPARGKVLARADSVLSAVRAEPGVALATPVLTDNALAIVDAREMPVTLKGIVPDEYGRLTAIDSLTLAGTPASAMALNASLAIASVGTAQRLGMRGPGSMMLLFAPRREGRVNVANPLESFVTDSVTVADVYRADQSEYDEKTVYVDIDVARRLFERGEDASGIEAKVSGDADYVKVAESLSAKLGPEYAVRDRDRMQAVSFHMVEIEKWITFLMLVFILVIASFNIISTLCMLVIEKEGSVAVLRSLGMTRRRIAMVFAFESWYVSLAGGLGGIAAGVALCLVQERFGIVKLAGDPAAMVVTSYPVHLEWTDLMLTLCPVVLLGALGACVAYRFSLRRQRGAK